MTRDYPAIQRVLIVTFLLNLLATFPKLAVGFATGALSLVADGLDSLFDGLSNIIGLVAVRVSSRPADDEYPYGHRKFETVAALFIATALFITAWELASGAIGRLLNPPPLVINWVSIGALLFGATVQGATGWWELRQARRLDSEVLRADARHTLTSIGVSAAVLAGLLLVWLGFPVADPLVALFVAAVIAKIGVDTVRENLPALVDRAALSADNIGAVVADVEGVESYHRIRSRGPVDNVAIDLHIRVAPHLSIQDANAIADEVRRRLLILPGVGDVTVHAEAERQSNSAMDVYTAVDLAAQELGIALHECWVQAVDNRLSLHLHVGVDPTISLAEAHRLVDQLEHNLMERQLGIESVHSHIELANREVLPSARVSTGLHRHIRHLIEEAATGISRLSRPHDIRVHQVEGKLFITLEALADGELTMTEAHELSTQLQEAIRASVPNVGEALIHLEPTDDRTTPDPTLDASPTAR